jgi:N6-L-threonylcarbamoyladenine synthase
VPMQDESFNFSFSGLKTAFLYQLRKMPLDDQTRSRAELLASFQEAALESLLGKVRKTINLIWPKAIVAGGGVAANSQLRKKLRQLSDASHVPSFFPPPFLCADNAAMIGYLAWKLTQYGHAPSPDNSARPRWPLESLSR